MLDWLLANWTEALGFVTGTAAVLLAVRRSVWNYPVGLANNLVFFWVFVASGLYGTAGLQLVFAVLAVHGWIRWTRGAEQNSDYIGSVPRRAILPLVLAGFVLAGIGYLGLANYTDSAVPVPDALLTATCLIAQYLLNRKWIQTWIVWIAADLGYIWLYATTGLHLTAVLYAAFAVMSVTGYVGWRGTARRVAAAAQRGSEDLRPQVNEGVRND